MRFLFCIATAFLLIQGCSVSRVASSTISAGASVVKTTAKAGGEVVDIVTPDNKEQKKKSKED